MSEAGSKRMRAGRLSGDGFERSAAKLGIDFSLKKVYSGKGINNKFRYPEFAVLDSSPHCGAEPKREHS
jgi:hypothetical protein